ncbi:hypothetical protein J7438_09905 [Thalassotalea sp. G20_0]|uniref:hypothetical protein n=1 Tax=Thalassotalea sp. G20_0 TaxID=2821093 RepID=UPI001ADC6AEC|nr:hypothetical protein [Thalassotalea sp. G20_0]MBO9494396.1 hypothetical protein [Thalassotalea sp. G20_0]
MGPISSHFSMFHEVWGGGDDKNVFRDHQSSDLFWRHGSGHKTFTSDGASNNLIEQATVDHVGCCLVSFDSGKRKVAPLNSGTRLLFRHQLPHESFLKPEKIKELSDRDIIVLHGFSELRDAQAFEHHLRVRSYYNKDGICILDKFPKWPSADQMASYGYVFTEVKFQGGKWCVDMNSIWQSKLSINFVMEMMNKDHSNLTMEDIYAESCYIGIVYKEKYLAELNAARWQPVLKLNHNSLQLNDRLTPVPAWRSVVQTEDSCLPELQLIMPANFDILPRCNPAGFGIAARTWPTGPAVGYDLSTANPDCQLKATSPLPQVRQPIKPPAYPFIQTRALHVARTGADSYSATLRYAGAVLMHLVLRR